MKGRREVWGWVLSLGPEPESWALLQPLMQGTATPKIGQNGSVFDGFALVGTTTKNAHAPLGPQPVTAAHQEARAWGQFLGLRVRLGHSEVWRPQPVGWGFKPWNNVLGIVI